MPTAAIQFTVPTVIIPAIRVPQPDGSLVIRPGKPVVADHNVSVAEAARILGMSPRTIEYQCSTGQFKSAIKPGGRPRSKWMISRAEVLARLSAPAD